MKAVKMMRARFGLKTLFVFTTACAACASYVVYEWRISQYNIASAQRIIDLGGGAVLDSVVPKWMRACFPSQSFGMRVTEARLWKCKSLPDVRMFAELSHMHSLTIGGFQLEKSDFKKLGTMTQLKKLDLSDTNIVDEDLAYLSALENLVVLGVANTRVTDDSIAQIAMFPSLKMVFTDGCDMSEDGKLRIRRIISERMKKGELRKGQA